MPSLLKLKYGFRKDMKSMKNQKNHVLRVMHINDTHSYFDESVIALHNDVGEKYYIKCGGFARISHQVSLLTKEAKTKGGNI